MSLHGAAELHQAPVGQIALRLVIPQLTVSDNVYTSPKPIVMTVVPPYRANTASTWMKRVLEQVLERVLALVLVLVLTLVLVSVLSPIDS